MKKRNENDSLIIFSPNFFIININEQRIFFVPLIIQEVKLKQTKRYNKYKKKIKKKNLKLF